MKVMHVVSCAPCYGFRNELKRFDDVIFAAVSKKFECRLLQLKPQAGRATDQPRRSRNKTGKWISSAAFLAFVRSVLRLISIIVQDADLDTALSLPSELCKAHDPHLLVETDR